MRRRRPIGLCKTTLRRVASSRGILVSDGPVTSRTCPLQSSSSARPTRSRPAISSVPRNSRDLRFGAFNVRGAHLAREDFIEHEIEAERLDGGGLSRVAVRVANVLPYIVLKIFAFQDRHENKDAYDLGFTLFNYEGGPGAAGKAAAVSAVRTHPQVEEALILLEQRFRDTAQDGPNAYASFLADPDDEEAKARLRQEAVAIARNFLLPELWNPSRAKVSSTRPTRKTIRGERPSTRRQAQSAPDR